MVFDIEQQSKDDAQSWQLIAHMRLVGPAPATYDSSARRKLDLLPQVRYETEVLASGLTESAVRARLDEVLAEKVKEQEEGMSRFRESHPEAAARIWSGVTAEEIFAEEQEKERGMYEEWLAGGPAVLNAG
jgi:hypothetical protein